MLNGELDDAQKVFKGLSSTRAFWAKNFCMFLMGCPIRMPSFFQIRNFLEIDISLLILYGRTELVENFLENVDLLMDINTETYKFVGRVLFKHGYMGAAKYYFDKSCEFFYSDVELHYLYVEFYLAHEDRENAMRAVETCLRLNSTYYPAIKTKTILT
jgi:hypothetical protein